MKPSRMRRYIVCSLACFILLLSFAIHDVAGTERGEYLTWVVSVKINPDDIEAHEFFAEWYIERGDYKKAAREIEAILRLSPNADLMSVIDTWCKLPEEARLAIQPPVRVSQEEPIDNKK